MWYPLAVVGLWILAGLVTALWMARRGHRERTWLLLGVLLGPILAVTAYERVERRPMRLAELKSDGHPPGHLRVLVGVDGSTESQVALDLAIELLGVCIRELVVAEVVDYDAAGSRPHACVAAARQRLTAVRSRGVQAVAFEVLVGPPAQVLARFAREHDIDIVVVGRHGRGLSKHLLGNVTEKLMREADLPVLVAAGSSADTQP